jgi:hypothetical protein
MADSIPAVLAQLAQSGVSVRWRDGKAVFKAAAAPPADIVTLIDARKAEVSAFLHPEAVQCRLDAEAEVLRAQQPPDVTAPQWEAALRGLRSFIELGHADEALRLGWPRDELYAVPPLWSRVDLCGAALAVGDREIVNITSTEIRIKTASGATLGIYRRPQPSPDFKPPEPSIPVKPNVPEPLDPTDAKSAETLRQERGRINRLIAGLIVNYPADRCLHCRKPIVAGQPWIPVSNGEATARFHKPCHTEWLGQQELAARRVLGLDP